MKSSIIRRIATLQRVVFVLTLVVVVQGLCAEECKPPSPQKISQATLYVAKRNHIPSSSNLSLVEYGKVSDSCFWMLHFKVGDTKREMTFYLSPDQEYLSTTLYDLQDDPLAEERSRAEAMTKSLLAGEPPARGTSDAKVTIVEFSDFECPYCKRMKEMLEKEVKPDGSPAIRIVFRYYPLSIHPWAKTAAQIAECVQLQNTPDFWKVHDFFFDNQQSLNAQNIGELSSAFISSHTAIDQKQFKSCLAKDLSLGPVMQDMDLGQKTGVRGTPTLFINGVRAEPIRDNAQLHSIIEAVERGESPLEMQTAPLSGDRSVSSQGGQCAPARRTGVENGENK